MISTLADSTEGGRGGAAGDAFGIALPLDPLAAAELEADATGALFWYHHAAPEAAAIPTIATRE